MMCVWLFSPYHIIKIHYRFGQRICSTLLNMTHFTLCKQKFRSNITGWINCWKGKTKWFYGLRLNKQKKASRVSAKKTDGKFHPIIIIFWICGRFDITECARFVINKRSTRHINVRLTADMYITKKNHNNWPYACLLNRNWSAIQTKLAWRILINIPPQHHTDMREYKMAYHRRTWATFTF